MKILIAALGILAISFGVAPLVDDEVLEPSVQNEVDRALRLAQVATNSPAGAFPPDWPVTNYVSLTANERAIRLVSAFRSDFTWRAGTNDVTAAAVRELRRLSGE